VIGYALGATQFKNVALIPVGAMIVVAVALTTLYVEYRSLGRLVEGFREAWYTDSVVREGSRRHFEETDLELVLKEALDVIGDEDEAIRWMGTPTRALDYATPFYVLHTPGGREAVMHVLGRLAHGIPG
jgi:uncharacterized protein (DUF2384 family)